MNTFRNSSRRHFIRTTAIAGAGVLLANSLGSQSAFASVREGNVQAKGLASQDKSGTLTSWSFERRPLGDNDVLIDIKFCGICHSDIHQMRGHWSPQKYPQVPGHEIAGIVAAVGKNVTKFKVGDRAGVGCMVNSCLECPSCLGGEENHCDRSKTVFTYGSTEESSPTGITQGGYASNIVVRDHFVVRIPDHIELKHAAPLLCAGITTYSPLMQADISKGDKVGVAGIGGLGHMAIMLAASKGAEVHAFTTSPSKVDDIKGFGAKEVIVVDDLSKLKAHHGSLDYMISTIPYDYDVAAYAMALKPRREFTQVGMPIQGKLTINNFLMIRNRVNFNGSLIGGMAETQAVVNYCADNKLFPQIDVIKADAVNNAWDKVVNKEARYRYVIDASTI
ncbi:NAD(P)-dependent alcohol dehydrogenase [Blastopirellula sp. JC732]|uniref:NAD(P)-dependent alcohol dehydrogenase n=1 Tax=Blastopirellula sediminis TaxID=2894196 RepID=A0A9X1MIE0_9BACT|nr:NAD(P)-dependent alcohol dehydrogenase [Blastopirellula sediminis]MCC9604275.1 NAD(P)-dependent alcohol dehydrogenase [Blastopirellula sediminis]MCC9626795.1 NAD(P)-dependent alcohol dehydrogenase [Blastopirellula sediminis]